MLQKSCDSLIHINASCHLQSQDATEVMSIVYNKTTSVFYAIVRYSDNMSVYFTTKCSLAFGNDAE
jgi:hypothetical protein